MNYAVVPFKGSRNSKSRLATALDERERQALATAMLEHVLDRLARCPAVAATLVVSSEPISAPLIVDDPGLGLNAAVRRGLRRSFEAGASQVVVLPADLPYLTVDDVATLLAAAEGDVSGAVAPAKDGGTGGLVLKRTNRIEPAFGPRSGAMHEERLAATGRPPALIHRSGLALDIDVPEDLDLLGDSLLDLVWGGNAGHLTASIKRSEQSGQDLARADLEI